MHGKIVIAFFIFSILHHRAVGDPDEDFLKKGDVWISKKNTDSAAFYFSKALEVSRKSRQWNLYLRSATGLAKTYGMRGEFEKEYDLLQKVNTKHEYDVASDEYFQFYKEYVTAQGRMEQYESAIVSIPVLMDMVRKRSGPEDPYLIRLSSNLGIIYGNLGFMERSRQQMKEALSLAERIKGEHSMEAAEILNNLGLVYKNTGNYESALSYYHKTLEIVSSLQPDNIRVLAIIRNNIGRLYSAMGKYDQGESFLEEALKFDTTYTNPSLYASFGMNEMQKEDYRSALNYFLISIRVREKRAGRNHPSLSHPMYLAGKAYSALHRFDSALWYFNKAIELENKAQKEISEDLADVYTGLSDMYEKKGEIRKAIFYINKALGVYYENFKPREIRQNPSVEMNEPKNISVLETLETKGDLFRKLGSQFPDSLKFIKNAYQCYNLSVKLLINYRSMVSDASAKIKLAGIYREIFEKTLNTISVLYRQAAQPGPYLSTAWYIMESNKSFNLRESLNRDKLSSLIPDSLTRREDSLKTLIAYFKRKIYNETKSHEHSGTVKNSRDHIFKLSSSLDDIKQTIRNNYPDYFRYIMNQEIVSLKKVRSHRLTQGTLILNYFYGDSSIFVMGVSRNKTVLQKINSIPGLAGKIKDLKSRQPSRFAASSGELYRTLAKPVLSQFSGIKYLTIVPDGILAFIPFEALISQEPYHPESFAGLSYLLHDYCISYSSSISLMNYFIAEKNEKPVKMLAFAPEFNHKNNSLLATRSASDTALFDELIALPQAEKEAKTVAGIFHGRCITGRQATESDFKKEISQANIIHVATHTIIDDENPLYSRLVFSHAQDSPEDGLLYVYELYHMKINADLVCLSACNTGFGRFYRGEGVVSLARGFLYAGVPNLMISLWTVADYSTATIMSDFYRQLADQVPKAQAIRKAKLMYLGQADGNTAAPYYWAGFILLQEGRPPLDKPNFTWIALSFSGGLLVIFFIGFYVIRKRKMSGI